jgi:hypothetical protein
VLELAGIDGLAVALLFDKAQDGIGESGCGSLGVFVEVISPGYEGELYGGEL